VRRSRKLLNVGDELVHAPDPRDGRRAVGCLAVLGGAQHLHALMVLRAMVERH
jgi:hypothetical protein